MSSIRPKRRSSAAAVFARHAFVDPWMRLGWYEAALIPELGAIMARGNAALRQLIAAEERTVPA